MLFNMIKELPKLKEQNNHDIYFYKVPWLDFLLVFSYFRNIVRLENVMNTRDTEVVNLPT